MVAKKTPKKRRDQMKDVAQKWRDKQTEQGRKQVAGIVSLETVETLTSLRQSESKNNGQLIEEAVELLRLHRSSGDTVGPPSVSSDLLTTKALEALQAIASSSEGSAAEAIERAILEALRLHEIELARQRREAFRREMLADGMEIEYSGEPTGERTMTISDEVSTRSMMSNHQLS